MGWPDVFVGAFVGALVVGLYARRLIAASDKEVAGLRGALKAAIRDRDQNQADKRQYERWLLCAEAKVADLEARLRGHESTGPEAA